MEMKGLRRRAVAAAGRKLGQPDPGSAGEGGSSPEDGEADRHCQTVQRSLSETEGVTRVNQWLNPLKSETGSNLVDVGRTAAHAVGSGCRRGLRNRRNAVGGEATEEGLRRTRGEAAGEELGADPVDR